MDRLRTHFADYAAHHTRPLNKATHLVGIPLIAVALLGLAARVKLPLEVGGWRPDLGVLLAAALVAVYLAWHRGLAVAIAALLAALYAAGRGIPGPWPWGLLALGVGLQYLGHYAFEGRAPAFHKNATHMLVGPLWVVAFALERARLLPAGFTSPPPRPSA